MNLGSLAQGSLLLITVLGDQSQQVVPPSRKALVGLDE